MVDDLLFLVANCPSAVVAEQIGRAAIEAGLSRAVNISAPMRTMYVWEGELVTNEEVQLIVKVAETALDALIAFIKARHPFEVAPIVAWRIDGTTPDYARFVAGH